MHKILLHSLLFSIAPESYFSLHLNDENDTDRLECGADKSKVLDGTIFHTVPNFLEITAVKWGLVQKVQI
jgi:hypothetical protein